MHWNGAWRMNNWNWVVNELYVVFIRRKTAQLDEAVLVFLQDGGIYYATLLCRNLGSIERFLDQALPEGCC